MYLEQLNYFLTLAECHSMHKTGELLHTSQQNVSRAILNLEKELGTGLFIRNSSGMFLTDDGRKVYELAKEIAEKTDRIKYLFDKKDDVAKLTLKGHFQVVTVPGYSSLLCETLFSMQNECPNLSLHLEEREALDVIDCLLNTRAEAALTTLDEKLQYIRDQKFFAEYEVLLLRKDYLKVMTTISSPLSQYQRISNKQLLMYNMVTYATSQTIKPLFVQILDDLQIRYKSMITSNSQFLFNYSLIKRNAIALSSDLIFGAAIKHNIDGLILLPMIQKIPIVHVYISKKNMSFAGKIFNQIIMQNLQNLGLVPTVYTA